LNTEEDNRITEGYRRIKILEFVKERQDSKPKQNTTKAIVIRYMKDKKLASRETTHYLINDLIKEGKLNKQEINSQVHFLTINDQNEFNKLNEYLSNLEKHIEKLEIPKAKPKKHLDVPKEGLIMWNIVLTLGQITYFPLKDNEILYRKIIQLLAQLALKKIRSMKEKRNN